MSRSTLGCVWCWIVALPLALLLALQSWGQEKLPEGVTASAESVHPAAVELTHRFDYRQLLVSGKSPAGEVVDLTRMATFTASGDCFAISADGVIRGVKDGAGELTIVAADNTFKVPVKVSGTATAPPITSVRAVPPVLSRTGCKPGT